MPWEHVSWRTVGGVSACAEDGLCVCVCDCVCVCVCVCACQSVSQA